MLTPDQIQALVAQAMKDTLPPIVAAQVNQPGRYGADSALAAVVILGMLALVYYVKGQSARSTVTIQGAANGNGQAYTLYDIGKSQAEAKAKAESADAAALAAVEEARKLGGNLERLSSETKEFRGEWSSGHTVVVADVAEIKARQNTIIVNQAGLDERMGRVEATVGGWLAMADDFPERLEITVTQAVERVLPESIAAHARECPALLETAMASPAKAPVEPPPAMPTKRDRRRDAGSVA